MIDSGWLRLLGEDGLETLLRRRPELGTAPAPGSLQELAERMHDPQAVVTALRRLDLPTLQVTEALAALGGDGVACDALARLLGVPAAATSLDLALTTLAELGLVWLSDRVSLVEAARDAFGPPLGLDPPVTVLLATLTAADLRAIAGNLGLRAPARKAELLAVLQSCLCDADRVRSVLRTATEQTRELLVSIAHGEAAEYYFDSFSPPATRLTAPRPWALARGLLIRAGPWEGHLLMPAEVALAVRGPSYAAPFDPRPPELAWTDVAPTAIQDDAIGSAGLVVRLVAELVDDTGRAPLALLRTGGVGVRDLRRLAKSLNVSTGQVRLALTLANAAGLLALTGGTGLPTDSYDDWLRLEPAGRAAVLLGAWWSLPRTPTAEPDSAWRSDLTGEDGSGLRHLLLGEAARRPGRAPANLADLAELAGWMAPCVFPGPDLGAAAVACWQEAALLGVVGANALSPIGHALVAGEEAQLRHALAALGTAQRSVRIQADLTAVVAGTPEAALADLLDGAAEREARGVASVWRFTPASVRRAMDGGQAAGALLAELEAVSSNPLPQPLRYLINDVARRHGTVRASEVACCLRSEDTALLAELAADRRLRGLGLRSLAPTVLASAQPLAATLTGLRAAGYAPVAESADGSPTIERPKASRTSSPPPEPRARRPAAVAETPVPALVRRLLDGPDAAPVRPLSTTTLRIVTAAAPHLSGRQARLLTEAIDLGGEVRIDYVNAQGRPSQRVIEEPVLDGNLVIAWCRLREDERMFNLSRIVAVSPSTALDDSGPYGGDHSQLFLAT